MLENRKRNMERPLNKLQYEKLEIGHCKFKLLIIAWDTESLLLKIICGGESMIAYSRFLHFGRTEVEGLLCTWI